MTSMLKRLTRIALPCVAAAGFLANVNVAQAGWADDWFTNAQFSSPSSYNGQKRRYYSVGSFRARWDVSNDYLFSVQTPRIKMGCGGLDVFLGGASMLDFDYLVQKMQNILQAAPALAFNMALSAFCKDCADAVAKLESIANMLNGLQINDCRLANQVVRVAQPNDPQMREEALKEMQADFGNVLGVFRNWHEGAQQTPQANNMQATVDVATEGAANCPAAVTDLFAVGATGTGSVIDNVAGRSGISSASALIRGYVGDVQISETGNFLTYTEIPPCPENDQSNWSDFLTANAHMRSTTVANCAQNTTTSVDTEVETVMTAVGAKLVGGGAYTVDETAFYNQMNMPIYRNLRAGAMSGTLPETVDNNLNLMSNLIGFRMADDLYREIGYMFSLAETARTASTDDDPTGATRCAWGLFEDGFKALKKLRERAAEARRGLWMNYQNAVKEEEAVRAIEAGMRRSNSRADRSVLIQVNSGASDE